VARVDKKNPTSLSPVQPGTTVKPPSNVAACWSGAQEGDRGLELVIGLAPRVVIQVVLDVQEDTGGVACAPKGRGLGAIREWSPIPRNRQGETGGLKSEGRLMPRGLTRIAQQSILFPHKSYEGRGPESLVLRSDKVSLNTCC